MCFHLVRQLLVATTAFSIGIVPVSAQTSRVQTEQAQAEELKAAKEAERTSEPLAQKNTRPIEYLVFEVPNLPRFGSMLYSWFVLRGSLLWTPTGVIDLSRIVWPKWETSQVPPALTYIGPNEVEIVTYDDSPDPIERFALKKAWSPQLHVSPAGRTPTHFRIEVATRPERARLVSKRYDWPKPKELFKCDVEVIDKDPDKASFESDADSLLGSKPDPNRAPPLEAHPKVQVCLESLNGVEKAAPDKQWYVEINWPRPLTRRAQMFISETERTLRVGLAKNKHVLIARRGTGRHFTATAGHTQIEKLEKPSLAASSLPNKDWHGVAPSREEGSKLVGLFPSADGGRIKISGFASDTVDKRSVDSPVEINPPINIQFVQVKEQEKKVRQTEFREELTGIFGFLRPWFLAATFDYHTLKSGRGEENSSLNGPSFQASWNSGFHDLEPFATLETGFVHQGSSLAINEGHGGIRWRWKPRFFPSLGYFNYALRGTNSGSSRLGSIEGISVGAFAIQRVENYMLRGWVNAISTSPISYDSYLEIGKLFGQDKSDRGLFVGFFFGYTVYRSDLTNLTRQVETFSETRFKAGFSVGVAGPDYLTD